MFLWTYLTIINHGDGIIYGDFIGPEERFNFGLEELELL
mgnify:FL=1